jgi:catechol 2,3-dioxygenase-like lactoylglutathione lyase family enzyme
MNMLSKLSHIALIVRDPSRTASLFASIFGAKTIQRTDEDGHDEGYVQLGDTWFVLVKADVERPLTGDHVAFLVSPRTLAAIAGKLAAIGHKYQLARSDTALYFQDFDNHVFELDTVGVESELRGEI